MNGSLRGILKTTRNPANRTKVVKFDDASVRETIHLSHRSEKSDSGFMYNNEESYDIDVPTLMKQLNIASDSSYFRIPEDSDDSSEDDYDYPEVIRDKVHRLEFIRRRKMHYKEFFSVPLARRLINEEWSDLLTSETTTSSEASDLASTASDMSLSESCSPENCELSDSFGNKSTESSIESSSLDDDMPMERDIEPGFDPTHRCYQKLVADANKVEQRKTLL